MFLFFAAALVCHDPVIVNTSGYEWTNRDSQVLEKAKIRCKELYEDAPCLKRLLKYGEHDYSATCGAKS